MRGMGPIHVRSARHEFLAVPGYDLRVRGRLTGATARARRSLARRGLLLLAALLAIALQPATPAGEKSAATGEHGGATPNSPPAEQRRLPPDSTTKQSLDLPGRYC